MNEQRKLTAAGANLIKHFESCHTKAYTCPAKVLTIGWGHTAAQKPTFGAGTTWTQERCDEVFLNDMVVYEAAVKRLVNVPLDEHQYDALVSFTYNVGEGNLAKSTLLKKVNGRDFHAATLEFPKWNKSNGKVLPGLTRRRKSEALLFQNILDENYDGVPDKVIVPCGQPMPQMVDDAG